MKMETVDIMQMASIILAVVLGLVTVFGGNIGLSDTAQRVIGVIVLINLPVLAYTTVIKVKNGRK